MIQIERLSITLTNERRIAAVWKAYGRWVAFQLATAFIAVAGCSDDSNRSTSDSTMEDVAQAVPTASSAPHPVRTTLSKNIIVADVFAGMWDYDAEAPFHTAAAEGILSIEGPCIYVIDDYAWLFPGTPLEERPDPIHIFVNMPRGRTKHDPDNQWVWVHNEGPMTSGDRIEMIGGGVDLSLPDICSTDIDRAFNVKTMAPKLCVPWLLPDHLSQAGCKPVPLDPFAGMWYYDEEVSFHQAEVEGILLIKEPCVYVIRDFGWLFPSTPLEELPDPVRTFVELPRDQTRYDPDTKSIWVHDDGPMVSGDRVEIGGGGFAQALPDACSADVGDIFTATSMHPKRCDPRWPPEHPSQTGCKPTETP